MPGDSSSIEFFRAVPLVLLIVFVFYQYRDIGILGCLVLGLMLYNGSVLAEVFRAGVLAVHEGPVRGGVRARHAQEPGDDVRSCCPRR